MNIRQTTVGPMGVYAYIVSCPETKEAAFIDPAGDEDRLVREAEAAGLKIKYILNTHGHCDHIGGNARIKELTGAEIIVGQPDEPFFGPGYAERCRAMGFPPSPPADKFVNDGDEIVIGQEKLTVLATPGHTPGGVCYYYGPVTSSPATLCSSTRSDGPTCPAATGRPCSGPSARN